VKWYYRLTERRQRYREVFESEDGKWVLADLATDCCYMQDPLVSGKPDVTCQNLGKIWVITHILKILRMTENELSVIVKQYEELERGKDEGIFKDE